MIQRDSPLLNYSMNRRQILCNVSVARCVPFLSNSNDRFVLVSYFDHHVKHKGDSLCNFTQYFAPNLIHIAGFATHSCRDVISFCLLFHRSFAVIAIYIFN